MSPSVLERSLPGRASCERFDTVSDFATALRAIERSQCSQSRRGVRRDSLRESQGRSAFDPFSGGERRYVSGNGDVVGARMNAEREKALDVVKTARGLRGSRTAAAALDVPLEVELPPVKARHQRIDQ